MYKCIHSFQLLYPHHPHDTFKTQIGVGRKFGRVSVLPVYGVQANFSLPAMGKADSTKQRILNSGLQATKIETQIIEGSKLTLEFMCMVTVAGILAGVGLATNNTVSDVSHVGGGHCERPKQAQSAAVREEVVAATEA